MQPRFRWDPCFRHQGDQAKAFLHNFLSNKDRRVLLVAAAGFDPRSRVIPTVIANAALDRTTALWIRENRPTASQTLLDTADHNAAALLQQFPGSTTAPIEVFARDGAIVGGRAIIESVRALAFDKYTDIVVDISAMSLGVFFPLIRFLDESLRERAIAANLHVTITENSDVEQAISAIASDRVVAPHGFQGGLRLDRSARAITLWLPQLESGRRAILDRVFRQLDPQDVCPILPFPASNPRYPDQLLEQYNDEFEDDWEVHARNVVFAEERNPVDLYRTLLRIDTSRKRVFQQLGGSLLVLSPLGNKSLALGAMMAAIERDFPVLYVEPFGYSVNPPQILDAPLNTTLHHVWLAGEPYAAQSTPPTSP
jgi:hypothetical protein